MFIKADDYSEVIRKEQEYIDSLRVRWGGVELLPSAEQALRAGKRAELLGDLEHQQRSDAEPSPASAGYAGEWEPVPGDTVRVKDPDQFVAPLDKQLRDRDGVVLRVWTPLGHWRCRAAVRFGKRNGRGKEFEHSLSVVDLMPWPKVRKVCEAAMEALPKGRDFDDYGISQ